MADSHVTITQILFDFTDPDFTEVTISFWGTDQSVLDTGTRKKRFPARMGVPDILKSDVATMEFLTW